MNYEEALEWLFSNLPMYQRIGAAAYKKDIHNTIKLCEHFGEPQSAFGSVHIAGTNGKGSTSHMIAAVLQESGYKVGLYTSPHLKSFTERIRINGKEISRDFVSRFVNENYPFFLSFDPSFFEITVAMAFCYFREEKVDVAVIETGLGGRLDSTNIITPLLSVITNIGLDHQNLLGETLPEIAAEKAGIIKKSVPVIIGKKQPEIASVFIKKANDCRSEIIFADEKLALVSDELNTNQTRTFTYREDDRISVTTDLLGNYQVENCRTALVALEKLKHLGFPQITIQSQKSGFANVKKLTGLKGRWEILHTQPLTVADTGHNLDGIRSILEQIQSRNKQQVRMVLGFVNDKNIDSVLQILPRNAVYYFTQASIPRALPVDELAGMAQRYQLEGASYSTVQEALKAALDDASPDDFIFIGGSTFVVAEVV